MTRRNKSEAEYRNNAETWVSNANNAEVWADDTEWLECYQEWCAASKERKAWEAREKAAAAQLRRGIEARGLAGRIDTSEGGAMLRHVPRAGYTVEPTTMHILTNLPRLPRL